MSFPTAGDYQEALQVPEAAFSDPELRRAEPEQDVLGLPRAITGAYAAVFPMRTRAGRVAVKCFLTDVADQQSRYEAIAAHLEDAGIESIVAFEYQPQGIRVEGHSYPLLKMPWVEGRPLNRFVEVHRDEPALMEALGSAWLGLVGQMEEVGMAHGDLQHGNVLVASASTEPRLRLVDLDTAFVPVLARRISPEVGHRNYQHPDRNERDFGPYVDRFAALVIFTAIQAVRAEPALWDRYDTGENLLFRASDFYDPETSPLFEELRQLDHVRLLAEQLRRACLLEPEDVPPLRDVVQGEAMPAREEQPRRSRQAVRPRPRRRLWPVLAGGAITLAILVGVLILFGGMVGAVVLLVVLGTVVGALWRRYRRMPVVRRRRRLRSEVAYYDALIDRLDAEIARLERDRRTTVEGAAERRGERLEQLREEALYDRLKYHFLQEATAAGLSHKVVVRLKAEGLRTAYDLTPETLKRVREVGERSGERLLAWRRSLEERYASDLPEALSPAQERRLENVLDHRLRDLDAEHQRACEKRRVQQEERADVLARLERVPHVGFGRYVASHLGLVTLRDVGAAPPVPKPAPVAHPPEAGSSRDGGRISDGTHDDAWWKQAS